MTMSRRKLSVLSSISGRGTFASSNEEIKLKYLFSNLHSRCFRKLFPLVLRPELYFGEGVYYYINDRP
jgi:hypothetical protein